MSYTKNIGYNISLWANYSGSGALTGYTQVGQVVDKIDNEGKVDMADTTLLSDKHRTFLPATADGGEIKFNIGYDPNDSVTYAALASAYVNGTLLGCQIKLSYVPTGGTAAENFTAYVAGLGRQFAKKDLNVVPVTLKISGTPAFAGT